MEISDELAEEALSSNRYVALTMARLQKKYAELDFNTFAHEAEERAEREL